MFLYDSRRYQSASCNGRNDSDTDGDSRLMSRELSPRFAPLR